MIGELLNTPFFQDDQLSYQMISALRAVTGLLLVICGLEIVRSVLTVLPRPVTLLSCLKWAVRHGHERFFLLGSVLMMALLLGLQASNEMPSYTLPPQTQSSLNDLTLYALLFHLGLIVSSLSAARLSARAACLELKEHR